MPNQTPNNDPGLGERIRRDITRYWDRVDTVALFVATIAAISYFTSNVDWTPIIIAILSSGILFDRQRRKRNAEGTDHE